MVDGLVQVAEQVEVAPADRDAYGGLGGHGGVRLVRSLAPMPLPNRVTPMSELVADPARGLVYGNRGCLHDRHGRITALQRHAALDRLPAGVQGLAARPEAPARAGSPSCSSWTRRPPWPPATARARCAGARTTTACASGGAGRTPSTPACTPSGWTTAARRLHDAALDDLPDGAFVLHEGEPWLVLGDRLRRWTPAGYDRAVARPAGAGALITPPSLVEVLREGWDPLVPLLHDSALRC